MKKLFIFIFLLCSLTLQAQYYVSNSGSDSNPGTQAQPFATISKANTVNGSVYFKAGDTFRGVLIPNYNGTTSGKTGIYCVGNSITAGGYPELLQAQLGSNFVVYNKGVGGDLTEDMLTRFPTDVTNNNDVHYVLIMAGTNDLWDIPVNTITATLQNMYSQAKAKGAYVVALTIPPIGAVTWDLPQYHVTLAAVNNWIKTTAIVDKVIDIYTGMDDPANPGSLRTTDHTDGLHFSASGYARMITIINGAMTFNQISTSGSITIGSYGTGAKPKILNSLDKSLTSDWTNVGTNLWRTAVLNSTWKDCGNLYFNYEAILGVKKTTLSACTVQGNFYLNDSEDRVYLYSTSNPGSYYTHIEIGGTLWQECLALNSRSNIIIQDLDLRYAGNNGIFLNNTDNIIIQRCSIYYPGGMYWGSDGTRMGNGVQLWENNKNVTVRNNFIFNPYDAGISPQGENACTYENIKIYNNVIVNFYYGFEYWLNANQTSNGLYIYNNTFVGAGKTWSYNIRPASGRSCHLKIWSINGTQTKFIVQNNIFKDIVDHAIYTGTGRNKITSNYNLWDVSAMAQTDEGFYTTLAQWRSATGQDVNSITGNPLLTTDYKLQSGSPAIDKGTNVGFQYNGSAPDMGAFEFQSTVPVIKYNVTVSGYKVTSGSNSVISN